MNFSNYYNVIFFISGKETLTPDKDQRTPTFQAQVDSSKKSLKSVFIHLNIYFNNTK